MKLFLDTSVLQGHPCGLSIYTISLYQAMMRLQPDLEITTGFNTLHLDVRKKFMACARRCISPTIRDGFHFFPGRFPLHKIPLLQRIWGVDNRRYDAIHLPANFIFPWLSLRSLERVVLTIHDMYAFRPEKELFFKTHYSGNEEFLEKLRADAPKVAAIVTVSQFSKKDIVRYLDVDERKIHVIPNSHQWNPIDLTTFHPLPQELLSMLEGERFFLAVGTIMRHKNYMGLVAAWKQFCSSAEYHGEKLVIVGSTTDEALEAEIVKTSGVVRLRKLKPEALLALYQNALGFLALSFVEGFGIPLLEAMAAGCPACYATGSSMDEVGRDACYRVHPEDIPEISTVFAKMRDDRQVTAEQCDRAKAIAREYSWENIAREYLKLFASLK